MNTTVKKWAKHIIAFLVVAAMAIALFPFTGLKMVTKADAGDVPAHEKKITENGDGTYKLELTVTGDADDDVQEAGGVNVVVVYDISQSMTSNAGSSSNSRADQAEDVVHNFLANLATYQNSAKDNIRVSLVTFAVTAGSAPAQGWITDVTTLANRFDEGGTDGNVNFSYTGTGTNWESALAQAQTLVDSVENKDPVFVVMITDGAPTASGNGNNAVAPTTAPLATLRDRYNAATDEASAIATAVQDTKGTFYGIYAYGTEADLLDDLMYYSVNGAHRGGSIDNVVAATEDAPNYFNAGETAQLQAAIDEIFDKVVQAMGISSAVISDGTTNEVATSTGEIAELLVVDESSYQYWLSIPVVEGKFTRMDRDGNTVEYTVKDNGDGTSTVTWGSNSVTVDGSVSGGQLKYEWTESNDLYKFDPPAAKLNGSSVDWDLSDVGTLLDGVTYSVTFDVYPSQDTLDIVADIKNDPGEDGAWGDLDPEVQKYIDVNGNLSTNTSATLTYVDTRTGESGKSTFDNPDPVKSEAVEQLAVTKEWENELDSQAAKPVTLNVTRDGEPKYEVSLSNDNDWKDTVYISIGILRTKGDDIEVLASGHDFTFTEPEDLTYHWELNVPTVRPMLIDGTETMLIKVDDKHQPEDGAKTYTIDDAEYYVGSEGEAALTAVNERRSSLVLTKEVTGEDAPEDAVFPFELTINNALAPEEEPEGDEGHDSDYWVWISVRDKDNNRINEGVEGATPEDGSNGWYYAPSGTKITIQAKAGYKIRINNLPTGSDYTIKEGDLEEGFTFDKAAIEATEGEGTTETFKGAQTSTGTIESTNTLYTVTYTNKYSLEPEPEPEPELTSVKVDKVWDDASDEAGARPKELTLTLKADGTEVKDKTPAITKSSDGNTWTYEWTELAKYQEDGTTEIKYTVTEAAVPEGYTCESATAENGGKITNKYTKEETPSEEKSVTVDPPVQKIFEGTDTLYNKGDFTFTITNVEAPEGVTAPMPTHTSVTNTETYERADKPGFYEFGEIKFTEPGTYVYKVTESGTVKNVTNDPDAEKGKTITFTVTADNDGNLSVSPTTDEVQLSFTNTYKEEAPKTGDSNNIMLLIALMVIAACVGASGIVLAKRAKKED